MAHMNIAMERQLSLHRCVMTLAAATEPRHLHLTHIPPGTGTMAWGRAHSRASLIRYSEHMHYGRLMAVLLGVLKLLSLHPCACRSGLAS